jgi:hypothetical protein
MSRWRHHVDYSSLEPRRLKPLSDVSNHEFILVKGIAESNLFERIKNPAWRSALFNIARVLALLPPVVACLEHQSGDILVQVFRPSHTFKR